MRIALLTDGISPYVVGGMQQHSVNLGKYLVENYHNVDLFHFVFKGQDMPTNSEVNNLLFNKNDGFKNIYCCYFPTSIRFPGHYIWNSYRYSKLIYNLIRKDLNCYDFIYSKGFTAWKLLRQRNKKINFKIGVNFHGYEMYQYAPNIKIKFQHFMLRPFVKMINIKADFIFSYGSKITDIIVDLGVDKTKIIEMPSAISFDWLNQGKLQLKKPLKYLFVGRYERRKGIQEINNVLLGFSKDNFEFHFAGSIPKDNRIDSDKIKVIYHGIITDEIIKKQIYDNCDVLICPSYSEGMPNVILEAMARGLAIIATDVGAVSLMVSSKNGILLDFCDKNLIENAIKKINLMDKQSLLEMKESSINKVRYNFIWSEMSKNLISKLIKK
tara:strand:- start:614 stop:1762 length:1149 start_codon:yes stop_codon:yes gene_type:complete